MVFGILLISVFFLLLFSCHLSFFLFLLLSSSLRHSSPACYSTTFLSDNRRTSMHWPLIAVLTSVSFILVLLHLTRLCLKYLSLFIQERENAITLYFHTQQLAHLILIVIVCTGPSGEPMAERIYWSLSVKFQGFPLACFSEGLGAVDGPRSLFSIVLHYRIDYTYYIMA